MFRKTQDTGKDSKTPGKTLLANARGKSGQNPLRPTWQIGSEILVLFSPVAGTLKTHRTFTWVYHDSSGTTSNIA